MMQNYLPTSFRPSLPGPHHSDEERLRNARSLLLLATLVTMALWWIPDSSYLLYPLRLFVTFIHESGHALMAIATGGSVESLHVSPDASGVTYVRDSPVWAWLTLSGGYLGATLFGAIMLTVIRLGRTENSGRVALYVTSGYLLAVTLLWAHNPFTNGFTLVSGILIAALIWLVARFSSPKVAWFAASFLAVQCCLNALGDLRTLFILTADHLGDNDAVFMSQVYGLPPVFWAMVWIVIAMVILFAALRGFWHVRQGTPRL